MYIYVYNVLEHYTILYIIYKWSNLNTSPWLMLLEHSFKKQRTLHEYRQD